MVSLLLQIVPTQHVSVLILGVVLLFSVLFVIFRAVSGPASHVPGPWHTRFTNVALKYYWIRGKRAIWVESLHQKYGTAVRLTPNEVSFTSLDAVKTIYTVRENFRKSNWYSGLVTRNTLPSVFSTVDVDYHRRHRRVLAGPMAESSLKFMLPEILSKIELAIQGMQREMKERGCIDVYKWWFFMATDTIGHLTFGSSFKMLETGKKNQYSDDVQKISLTGAWRGAYPKLVPLLAIFSIPPFKDISDRLWRVRQYAFSSLKRLQDRASKNPDDTSPTLFSKIMQAFDKDLMSFEEVVVNSQGYIVAGSDTTSNTLTYLVWELCKRPAIRDALVKELQTLPEDYKEEDLRRLPYLDGVINETLRCNPVVASSLPRAVPPEGVELDGYFLAGGMTVSTQSYSMHFLEHIFPDAHDFNPRRWHHPTKAMKDAFMPFGRGSRICLGMHLAMIELRLAIAKFFLTFPNVTPSTREGMSDKDMVKREYFLVQPVGDRCLVEG